MLTARTDTMMVWMVAEMTAAEESKLAFTICGRLGAPLRTNDMMIFIGCKYWNGHQSWSAALIPSNRYVTMPR